MKLLKKKGGSKFKLNLDFWIFQQNLPDISLEQAKKKKKKKTVCFNIL